MKKWIPIFFILVGMAAIYFSGMWRSLDFETLRYHHVEMTEYVNNNPLLTPFMYTASLFVVTALSLPGGLLYATLAGFLFKQPLAWLYVMIGETSGAFVLFLSVKMVFGNRLKGSNKNAANYLLFLRFVPFVPFWLANLVPAFFNVRFRTFLWTTIVGIAPSILVITLAGRGLNTIFETAEGFSFWTVFDKKVVISLCGMGVFSLLPIALKRRSPKKRLLAREEKAQSEVDDLVE